MRVGVSEIKKPFGGAEFTYNNTAAKDGKAGIGGARPGGEEKGNISVPGWGDTVRNAKVGVIVGSKIDQKRKDKVPVLAWMGKGNGISEIVDVGEI